MTGSTIGSARERAVVAIGIAGLVVGTSALVGSAVAAQPVPTCFGAPATAVSTPNADVM
jgi:hypothetical protein